MYINQTELENLDKGLKLFIEVFRPYVVSILTERFGDDWAAEFAKTLPMPKKENWEKDLRKGAKPENLIDFQYFKGFALDRENQKLLEDSFEFETKSLPTWFGEIYDARNAVKHYNPLEEDKALKAWIHLRKIVKLLGHNELEQRLLKLQKNESPRSFQTQTQNKKRAFSNSNQYSTETLDIINCSGSYEEVFAEEVYFCPAESGTFTHRQCKYFGAYFQKRVGAVGEIEAVVDVHSENEAEIYWANGNQNAEEYVIKAKEKAIELRPSDLPIRVFLLKDLYSTEFIKDSKGGMQGNKIYLSVEDLNVANAKELAEKLNGKNWSDFIWK